MLRNLALLILFLMLLLLGSGLNLGYFLVWVGIILLAYIKLSSQLVNLLLLMEFITIVLLLLSFSFLEATMVNSLLLFVLLTLFVGEAVLGLAVLVRNYRTSDLKRCVF